MSEYSTNKYELKNYELYIDYKSLIKNLCFTRLSQYFDWCSKNQSILSHYNIPYNNNIYLYVINNIRDEEGRIPWISYYEFLGCEYLLENYPRSIKEWREKVSDNKIYSQESYYIYCDTHDDLPVYPYDVYKNEGFREELYREIYECY